MENEQPTGFHFEEFTRIPTTTRGKLCASIYMPAAQLYLNAMTFTALGHPEAVILLFDHHKQVIGVKPTYNPVPHAIRVRHMNSREHRITVSDFLAECAIDLGYSIRFIEPYVDGGTLILDLNRTMRVIGSRTIARQRREADVKTTRKAY